MNYGSRCDVEVYYSNIAWRLFDCIASCSQMTHLFCPTDSGSAVVACVETWKNPIN
jgi:hypothetical protein